LFCDETQGIIQESSVTNLSCIFMAMVVYLKDCAAFSLQVVHTQTLLVSQAYQRSCWWRIALPRFAPIIIRNTHKVQ